VEYVSILMVFAVAALVAGALMGYAVGSSVGRAFHNRVQGKQAKENATRFRLTPYIYEEYSGLQVAYRF